MSADTQKVPEYEGWAVVEIMGHKRLAGYVREASMFGTAMLRIDVPGEGEAARATQYYGGSSIYCVTPCTEEIARSMTKHAVETPEAVRYALPSPKRCEESWRFSTPCSPDIAMPEELAEGEVARTICGRHKLQLEHEPDAIDRDAVRDLADPGDFELDPRD